MFPKYSIDTRSMQFGDVYIAIRGEKHDGHDFLHKAVKSGATGLIIDKSINLSDFPAHIKILQVHNCQDFIAQEARTRLNVLNIQVISITGSVGKTTTKNAIANVLSEAYDVASPKGNLNTLLGASLTILNEVTKLNQKFVVEVGTYQQGNISNFCKWIKPSVAVVTNVQPVHLERMGSLENIASAKGELVESLESDGIACLNWDDPRVKSMQSKCKGTVISYGTSADADITPTNIQVEIPLLGNYKLYTAMAAYAVGSTFGLNSKLINSGLSKTRPEKGRLTKLRGRNDAVVIDDTYNASLSSSLEALVVLKQEKANRKIAILGDMLELGHEEDSSHVKIVCQALEVADIVMLVGSRMNKASSHCRKISNNSPILFENYEAVINSLPKYYQPKSGDVILVKGSAGMRMENAVEILLASDINPSEVLVRQEKSWKTKKPEDI